VSVGVESFAAESVAIESAAPESVATESALESVALESFALESIALESDAPESVVVSPPEVVSSPLHEMDAAQKRTANVEARMRMVRASLAACSCASDSNFTYRRRRT
jgi:hypothetical protein